jgi:hypothetical protein
MTDPTGSPITQQFMHDVEAAMNNINYPPPVGAGIAVGLAKEIADATTKALLALEARIGPG